MLKKQEQLQIYEKDEEYKLIEWLEWDLGSSDSLFIY